MRANFKRVTLYLRNLKFPILVWQAVIRGTKTLLAFLGSNLPILVATILSLIILLFSAKFFFAHSDDVQKLDSYGSFLAGVFASLAFIWVFVAGILQHKQLTQNFREMLMHRAATELSMRTQQIEMCRSYRALLVPLLYSDCRRIVELAHRLGHLKGPLPTLEETFNEDNLATLSAYIESENELRAALLHLAAYESGNVAINLMRRLVVRMSILEDITPPQLEWIDEALPGGSLGSIKYLARTARELKLID